MSKDWTVAVEYRETESGLARLRYAADLSAKLDGTLTVLMPYRQAELALAATATGQDERTCLLLTCESLIAKLTALSLPNTCRRRIQALNLDDASNWPEPQVVVGPSPTRLKAEIIIDPAGETLVSRVMPLKLLVPFGNGPSASAALESAARLAQRLGAEVILYHTTWREPKVVSTDPRDHMCTLARDLERKLLGRTSAFGLKVTSVVEMVDDVAEGLVRAAYAHGCCLIVMARSPHILRGSQVATTIKVSAIPVADVTVVEETP